MKLTAYDGTEIPNLGSCQVYVKGPNNPYPKSVDRQKLLILMALL